MRNFLKFALLTLGVTFIASSAFADIPQELKIVANKLSFLAAIAKRCNTSLEVRGKTGVNTEACVEFSKKLLIVLEEVQSTEKLMLKTAREVDNSKSFETKLRWRFFQQKFESDLDSVFKVSHHIRFLKD